MGGAASQGTMSWGSRATCRSSGAIGGWRGGRGVSEVERFPVGVEDQERGELFLGEFGAEGHAVRVVAPVGLELVDAVPGLGGLGEQFAQAFAVAFVVDVAEQAAFVE